MRKIYLTCCRTVIATILLAVSAPLVFAQTDSVRLWGTTSTNYAGPGYGGIFSENPDGTDYKVVKRFLPNPDGSLPLNTVTKLSGGQLLGMTSRGGNKYGGVIYKTNPDGSGYTKLFDFSQGTGSNPHGKLLQASNGYLYGMTAKDTSEHNGSIFKIQPDGNGFTKLHSFSVFTDGGSPNGNLMQASDGNLYGMTETGGANSGGTIFMIATDGSGFVNLHDFDAGGGVSSSPNAGLIEGTDGFLYGMTGYQGSIFRIKKDGSSFQVLHVYDVNGGFGNLIQLSNGKLTGVTYSGSSTGGGTLFSLDPDGSNYTVLFESDYNFLGGAILSASGQLYGIGTLQGYSFVVYRIETDGTGFTIIATNNNLYSDNVFAELCESTPGTFIGVGGGGTSNGGVIFQVTDAGALTIEKDFPQEGAEPQSELLLASDGDLYGTTNEGGLAGSGILFKIKTDGSGYTSLYDFTDFNYGERIPTSKLIEHNGFLYGTRKTGVFKVNFDGSNYTPLYTFSINGDYGRARGNLLLGTDNFLYGITSNFSSPFIRGILYKLDPDDASYTTILDFATTPASFGYEPVSISLGADGMLYVITNQGGASSAGVLFKIKTDGTEGVKLKDLDFSYSSLISKSSPLLASDGRLYGTTFFGSSLYSMNADGSGFSLHLNDVLNQAVGSLIEPFPGHFYGLNDIGRMFRFDLSDSVITAFPYVNDGSFSGLTAVQKKNQTMTFNALASKTFGDAPVTAVAHAASGLPVTFSSSNPAVASVAGNTITILGAGTVNITATQSGTIDTAPAHVTQSLVISKASQTISFSPINAKVFGDAPFDLTVSAASGITPQLLSNDIVKLTGITVTIVKPGKATITASQSGNENYNPAANVQQSFCVNPSKPVISAASNININSVTLSSNVQNAVNQWYLNGASIAGATDKTYVATLPGVYTVIASAGDCASETSEPEALIFTGLERNDQEAVFIWKNNSTGEFNIQTPWSEGFDYTVLDILGKTARAASSNGGAGTFELNGCATGVYIVKIVHQNAILSKRILH